MKSKLSLGYSLDWVSALFCIGALLGVLQTFIIGRHFLIPTMILLVAVLFGNLARFGFRDRTWAKHVLFWLGFVLTCHVFFALFWAQKYREILGTSFEYVFGALTLALAYLVWQYAKRNRIFD